MTFAPISSPKSSSAISTQTQATNESAPQSELSWSSELKQAVRDPQTLGQLLRLPQYAIQAAIEASNRRFPLLVTRAFASRMRQGDLNDPLLKQVWPVANSSTQNFSDGYSIDPVGDSDVVVADGLLHKYHGRVLLVTTGACAIHCHYCFRQNFEYSAVPHQVEAWRAALDYIASDTSITEVILSGGDPLMLVDKVLIELVAELEHISHLRRLRIHTRLPIVLPSRINNTLIKLLSDSRFSKWIVIHCNHANEIDSDVEFAIAKLQRTGATILNQAVLLRGVNDSVDVLEELSLRLVDLNVMPYYLHQLDRVAGSQGFEVGIETGQVIIEALQRRLPGYAVPKFVQEIAGQPSKTPIGSASVGSGSC